MSPDADQLAAVLAGDDVTWPAFFLRSGGETVVAVGAVRRLAGERGLDLPEDRLDELVAELGGRRECTPTDGTPSRRRTSVAGPYTGERGTFTIAGGA